MDMNVYKIDTIYLDIRYCAEMSVLHIVTVRHSVPADVTQVEQARLFEMETTMKKALFFITFVMHIVLHVSILVF
jgi:hypothetical protein